jgi:ribosomal peptide maturation radical SAM protein 1
MGAALAENFPFIDTVVSGEGEGVILDLVHERLRGKKPKQYIHGDPIQNMDDLPVPDFSDYFGAVEGDPGINQVRLVVEASRGCWWGAKSHCTFCGFNGTAMPYRSKTPQRFVNELRLLRSTYKTNTFLLTDNILNMNYFKTVLPVLAEDKDGFRFNCETKANLRKDQIDTIAMAGAFWIQAGIESLSSDVLRTIKKGTTLLQNLQTLKWCQEAGVYVAWSFLYGFPGEDAQAYGKILELIPLLGHIQPPQGSSRVQLHRFSPFWNWPEQYGLVNITHAAGYDFVYPVLPPSERKRLAYSFDFAYSGGETTKIYFKDLESMISGWRVDNRNGAVLRFESMDGRTAIKDSRLGKNHPAVWISLVEEQLLHAFDRRISIAQACKTISRNLPSASPVEIREAVAKLKENKWIIGENEVYISLVLDFSRRDRLQKLRSRARQEP